MSSAERPATRLWREALAQVDVLLQTSGDDRERSLRDLQVSRPHLHSLVASLLDAEHEAAARGFLEPVPTSSATVLKPGGQIGHYRLTRRLGEGGMGDVWLARRDDGLYDGDVAIKTLHPYFAGGALRERFLREAQLLGRLTHPNIARLLDAGIGADGTVYLVLEYVDGVDLAGWCDQRQLDIEARLKLFLDVCAGVAHAHANLIVHRDIKPSNILVNTTGAVKLLDFGIAKLVESEPVADARELTRLTGRIFTPEYAAPEQVLGQAITTATDVYSLGVLLHVLLSGSRPYGQSASGAELERAILHDEPARLGAPTSDPQTATTRSMTPQKLRRALSGDLESIVARALQKAPQDRYASVLAFAEDVQRHLAHQPILARPDSLAVRSRKFVRRHRVGVAAAALVVLATSAAIAAVLWQAQVARVEAQKATAIKDFLLGIFERNSVTHPDGARARQTTAEELLAQSAQQIRTELKETPEVRAELLDTITKLYAALDMQREALPLREEHLALLRATPGVSELEIARALTALSYVQTQIGDYAAAEKTTRDAVARFEAIGERSAHDYAMALSRLGHIAYRNAQIQDGVPERYVEASQRILDRHHPRSPERVDNLLALARFATLRKDNELSMRYCEQAGALLDANAVDATGMNRGAFYQVMSVRLRALNRYEEAERSIRQAQEEFERTGGPEHPFTIDTMTELGTFLNIVGRRPEATQALLRSVAALERTKGVDDPELTTNARVVLSRSLVSRGDLTAAEPHLARAMNVIAASKLNLLLPAAKLTLGQLQIAQGRVAEAERFLADLESISVAIGGEKSLRHGLALARLGQLELARKRYDKALSHFEAIWSWPDEPGQVSFIRASAGAGLMRHDYERGDFKVALVRGPELLALMAASRARPEMTDQESDTHMFLGAALLQTGDPTRAKPHLARALEERMRMDVPHSPWLAEARLLMAQCLSRLGERKEAQRQLQLAAEALDSHPRLAPQYTELLRSTRTILGS